VSPLLTPGTAAIVRRQATPEPERELPTDPVAWARDEADTFLWSRQREIARSVVENRETLVPACHSAGKTKLAAVVAAYWIAAHPGEARVVTTAPSDEQVQGLLWHEIARTHRAANLPGRVTLDAHWYVGPRGAEELVGWGRKPQDRADVEQAMTRFQGAHARYLLVILDEATGIPPWLWNAVDSLASNENARILAIGNPDDPTSTFAARCDASTGSMHAPGEAYTTARGAKVLPIDAYMTPNFTGEHVPEYLREMLVARSYAEGMIGLHGEDNPLVISKVRGLFPDRSSRNVISPALIGAAWRRELPGMGRGRFGLDVSRSVHGDECALYRDRDGVLRVVEVWRDPDSAGTTARVFRATAHTPETPIVVDTDGVGGPVFDVLRRGRPELGAGVGQPRRCVPFSVNKPPRQPRDFDTRRSEVWWAARDELIAGLWDLDPADEELAAQLAAPRWTTDHRGRIHVETKEEMAKRGVSSPDRADAVIMARFGRPPIGSAQGYPPNGKAKNGNGRGSVTADLLGRPM
jgi:hypothetical protein